MEKIVIYSSPNCLALIASALGQEETANKIGATRGVLMDDESAALVQLRDI